MLKMTFIAMFPKNNNAIVGADAHIGPYNSVFPVDRLKFDRRCDIPGNCPGN
jgi:hypothetical protein